MFGFPVNLQDSGVQKFTNDADNGFPKIQQREVFYSVKDGEWRDPTIWQTASGRVGLFPGQYDDVYIKNVVQIGNTPYVGEYFCNNLYISGTFNFWNRILNVYGNFKNVGTVNSGLGTGFFSTLKMYGIENILGTINQNNWTNITYTRNGNQNIVPFNYYRLSIDGLGTKYLTSNTIVSESLYLNAIGNIPYINGLVQTNSNNFPGLECAGYELDVFGITFIGQWNIFKQSGSGSLTFRGQIQMGFGNQYSGGMLLYGNPNVECRNGLFFSYDSGLGYGINGRFYSGTGTWRFTTNNQFISTNVSSDTILTFDAPISIAPGITLSHHNQYNANGTMMYLNNTINGESSTSKFENRGNVVFQTAASVPSMTTGIFDFTTYTNTITYGGNYTATIPSYFTTFHNLTISGTGTKSLGVNTTLNGNLNVTNGTIDFATYDITINGTSTININPGKIMKSGSGNVTFVGLLTIGTTGNNGGTLDFSGGNPNVEFRNGYTGDYSNAVTFKTGTGTWRFTTNNQRMGRSSGGGVWNYDCPILIENITLQVRTDNTTQGAIHVFKNSVNGTTAGSSLINYSTIEFQGPTTFMTTGTFDFTTNVNTIQYSTTTSFSIPLGSFWSLSIVNVGVKTLTQNTTILGNLSVGNSIINFSNFDVEVYGTTSANYGTLQKTGAGNVIFRGLVDLLDNGMLNFSGGNPNVEFRNGMNIYYNTNTFLTGTGTWSFTTNNQSINGQNIGGTNYQFNCTISIVNINLTLNSNNRTYIFINAINGTTSTSSLIMATSSISNYQSSTQPMITGILDTSTNLNTWIYGSGNQDIKGGPTTGAKQVYRNLTLNGGGVKTLQGYVSVQNTYTLTSPATLNNNGFTLTNP